MSVLISLLPVIIFLIVLNSLDTFKLLKLHVIASVILWGSLSALLAYPINNYFFSILDDSIVSGFAAPLIEELLKFTVVIFLFYKNKLGFLSDALIIGFASGSGFSIVENLFYLNQLDSQNIMLWVIRGLGTAIMHGTATAISAVIAQNLISRKEVVKLYYLLVGVIAGFFIHALFNNFFLTPLVQTILQISLLPLIIIQIFTSSEKSLRNWMEEQSSSEFELLRMIKKGDFKSTRAGKYILSIKSRFSPEIILDMLAYIQLHLELSIKAKAQLLMKETGFNPQKESEIENMLSELEFLSKSIGKTGMRTLAPIIKLSGKDIWKLNLLK
jgi:RsiW-degrading membrane proteinase PrsW (M82 family)